MSMPERRLLWSLQAAAVALLLAACSGTAETSVTTTADEIAPTPTTSVPLATASIEPPTTTTMLEDVITTTEPSPFPPGAIVVAPGDDLRGLVAAASAGSVFVLDAGTHRMQSAEPKDGMVFLGVEDTVMSGARLLGEFVVDGRLWRFDDVAMTGGQHGLCVEGYDGCVFDQDLFLDDVMLWQVTDLADLAPGRWYWDGDSIYMADDPTERLVELSVAPYAFISSADDVTIKDLEIEKYATPAQDGAVSAQEPRDGPFGERWLIEDVEVSGVHGAGVRTGHSTVVRNSFLHSNGQLGLTAAGGSNVLIEGNEISNNNLAGFRWGWEAGGAKFTETVGLIVRSNSAHDNDGPGLWTDIDAVDTLFEGNTVTANSGPGIFHEISYAAVIRANTVVGNGFGKPEWLWGAGILIAASRDVEVSGNVVADNADGIAGIQQERGSGLDGPYLLQNVTVTGNDISMADGQTGVVADVADAGVFVDRNIVFAENTYRSVSGIRYAWGGDLLERGDWLVTGQGVGSVWL